ncbi:MAG TPA: hypothetical protein VHA33_17195 [Candidatus Angelobacter sp.]|jgi:hypothetical protein|nr:hypothetical protein [Candidatus Angelobacter sp.]
MNTILITIFLLLGHFGLAAQEGNVPVKHRLADSLQGKLDHIRVNGEKVHPDQTPTLMTEDEINDYLASGRVKLPQGVKKVTLEGHSGIINGLATVDFDEIRAGQHSSNPLLSIFNGTHNVRVEADGAAANGTAKVHVRSVSIDGIDVPRIALEYFVNKYIAPKYPNIGIDSTFALTDKIDIAIIGYHKLTLTQK